MEELMGKNLLQLVHDLPSIEWKKKTPFFEEPVSINHFNFISYDNSYPRDESTYFPFDNEYLSKNDLSYLLKNDANGFAHGLSSIVLTNRKEGYTAGDHLHIPMIDFDMDYYYSNLSKFEKIDLIKKQVREVAQLDTGVILQSGPKENFHYLGLGTVLDEDHFVTFIGLALTMKHPNKDGKWTHIADPKYLGHCLTAMKYFAETEEAFNHYTFPQRLGALRITPKEGYSGPPVVVDAL